MKLFAFGSNGSGQLGIGHTEDVSIPTQCQFTTLANGDEIVQIAAGGNHTLVRTREGHVYAAGCNTDGRCVPESQLTSNDQIETTNADIEDRGKTTPYTSEDESLLLRFRRVIFTDPVSGPTIETFKCISATWEGSILVAGVSTSDTGGSDRREDRVFVLGSSPKGELGLGQTFSSTQVRTTGTSLPNFPPQGSRVVALGSGMSHTVAVLANGDVYGWGGSRKGQLGESLKAQKIVWAPARVEGIPFRATGAVCGREFTVVFGQRDRGEFVVLGDPANRWGITKIPDYLRSKQQESGHSLGMSGYLDIQASWHGVYVQVAQVPSDIPAGELSAKTLVAWGRDDRGQLPPSDLPVPAKIAVGSEHVLALLHDGSVAAFGWGEHGNCGADTNSRGDVSGSYKLIPLPDDVCTHERRVVGLGAGCATSWLIVD